MSEHDETKLPIGIPYPIGRNADSDTIPCIGVFSPPIWGVRHMMVGLQALVKLHAWHQELKLYQSRALQYRFKK